jgi:hypothetical protein
MRLSLPRVIPIEVWDLPVAGKLLQEWRDDASFSTRIATMVIALRDAPPTAFSARARATAAAISRVHLVGGAADEMISAAIGKRGVPCSYSADPFAAALAGAALRPGALCADIGQTAIKLVHGDRAWRIERDLEQAPLRDGVPLAERSSVRRSTLAFLASVLHTSDSPHASAVSSLVLALPCELDDAGAPRSCSYCWPDPDRELVDDLRRLTGHPIEILNDAELAALAASLDPAVPHDATTLVLTIGFGVGGALLEPR